MSNKTKHPNTPNVVTEQDKGRFVPAPCSAHLTMVIGEVNDGDYSRCDKCGEKTMLISAPTYWSVDQEPFKADERVEALKEVEVYDEISAHYCNNCNRITNLSFNQCR